MQSHWLVVAMGIIFVHVIACLFVVGYMLSQMRSKYAGIYDPLFVGTDFDSSDSMHMAAGALQGYNTSR